MLLSCDVIDVGTKDFQPFLEEKQMATAFILGSGIQNYIDAVALDLGNPTDITNAQIRDLIVKAIRRVNWRIGTSFSYYSTASGIAPIPTETQGDIIILQAECLLSKRRYTSAVSKGISVKDGDTAIDSTSAFKGYDAVMKDVCGDLDRLINEYKLDQNGAETNGDCIWYGNTNTEYDCDHNGDQDVTRYYESPFDL